MNTSADCLGGVSRTRCKKGGRGTEEEPSSFPELGRQLSLRKLDSQNSQDRDERATKIKVLQILSRVIIRKQLQAGKEPTKGPETVPAPSSLAGKSLIHGALDKALRKGLCWRWETASFRHIALLQSHPTRHKSTTFSIFFPLAILTDVYSSLTQKNTLTLAAKAEDKYMQKFHFELHTQQKCL